MLNADDFRRQEQESPRGVVLVPSPLTHFFVELLFCFIYIATSEGRLIYTHRLILSGIRLEIEISELNLNPL